jgi:TIR domain
MDIFISWSGKRSRAFAEALRDWLPMIINAARPFLSSSDIDKGARWSTEIASRLEKAKAGIICLTPSNMQSEWILFEAGALSKTLADTYVCTLLIDMKPTDVKGPLAQFQATTTSEADMLQLVKTLNSKLGESGVPSAQLEKAFKLMWPELRTQIVNLPKETASKAPGRPAEDMLEELLGLVRNLSRSPSPLPPSEDPIGDMRRMVSQTLADELGKDLKWASWDFSAPGLQGKLAIDNPNGEQIIRFAFPPWSTPETIRAWVKEAISGSAQQKKPAKGDI